MIASSATVQDRLAEFQTATASMVARFVSGREPRRHLYDPLRSFTMQAGKGIRPALCLATCEAFGGPTEDALPAAAAIELLHAAFLIHDDIEDDTAKRRGNPAFHIEHGVPIALNAGDALAVLSLRPLLESVETLGSRTARLVLAEFQSAMERTVEGQAVELGWRVDDVIDLTPIDYLDLVLRKTCAYTTILPMRVGALVGAGTTANLDGIARFGFALGAAFQIQDDVLDIVSPRASYGKDLHGDLREGKRTLMLIHLARVASPADRAFVEEFLGASDRSERRVQRIAALMRDYGSIDFASEYAARMADAARAAFDDAFSGCPESDALVFLRELVPFMVERRS
jgi:geranylgeranyl diphosphate synthase type II